jgi:hypothetical protein
MIAYASGHTAAAQSIVARVEAAFLFPLISFLFAMALLYFMWGAYQFVANADSDSARDTGKSHMMYGIIGMLVMISAFAILKIAAGTFGITVSK